jgi:5-oxoprolinase (ATP-hydrolysing)
VREFEFLEKMTVSLLTQRRALSPRGGEGGGDGGTGRQTLVKAGGGEVVLPGTTSFEVQPGDRIVMETPGGGGWGKA